jgi:tRNA dimethylallyltransferase
MNESEEDKKKVVVVSGPTACGKSALAIRLAQQIGGEIVNIDSVQIYRGLDIGSAKVPYGERQNVPHHLLDIRDPNQSFNVHQFLEAAYPICNDVIARGKVPILCGGTNMYLSAFLHGLAPMPDVDPQLREALELRDTADLHQELQRVDPASAARIHANDRLRVVRALEMTLLMGVPASQTLRQHAFSGRIYSALICIPCWQRTELYERIDQRSYIMLRDGLIAETARIVERFGREAAAMRTLGYAQALKFLDGEFDEVQMVTDIAQETRRFAKRQTTFWRNEPGKRGWLPEGSIDNPLRMSFPELAGKITDYLSQPQSCNSVLFLDANFLAQH